MAVVFVGICKSITSKDEVIDSSWAEPEKWWRPFLPRITMFDLNLTFGFTEESTNADLIRGKRHPYNDHDRGEESGSGTSNSSVVNADFSSNNDSCSTPSPATEAISYCKCALTFDVWKPDENRTENENHAAETAAVDFAHRRWIGLSTGKENEDMQHQPFQRPKKSRRGPRSRSSQYRGVTFYRRTGRWESHIWDRGKQIYLGGFDTALSAARAYDRAAIKFRGVDADINFHLRDYEDDMLQISNLSKEEFIHILRRQSSGFSRGSSKYRSSGGAALHSHGRWESRMRQFFTKKVHEKTTIQFTPSDGDMIAQAHVVTNNIDLSLRISPPSINEQAKMSILRTSSMSDHLPCKDKMNSTQDHPMESTNEGKEALAGTGTLAISNGPVNLVRQMGSHAWSPPATNLAAAASSRFSFTDAPPSGILVPPEVARHGASNFGSDSITNMYLLHV